MAVGITSLDDCPMLTWSFGCTGVRLPFAPPRFSIALLEITSLAFMLVEVPEPVWNMSTTNWSSNPPLATSREEVTIASEMSSSSSPSSRLTSAAASLIDEIAAMNDLPNLRSLMGKFNTARIVFAP